MPWYSKEKNSTFSKDELPLSKFLVCLGENGYLREHTSKVIYWTYLIVKILDKFEDDTQPNQILNGLREKHVFQHDFDEQICELIINEVVKKIAKPSELKEFDKNEGAFLLTCALYHDIGKLFIRARHGQEGADIIKDIGDDDLLLFNHFNIDAGTNKRPIRKRIVFMSELIRYHDYFGTLQTGEASYLLFLDVLNPIINNSLINYESKFLRYLLFLNIADILATVIKEPQNGDGKNEDKKKEDEKFSHDKVKDCFSVLIDDYKKIECIKINYAIKTCKNLDKQHFTEQLILSRNLNHLINELRQMSEDATCERLRRLLRTTCINVLGSKEYDDLNDPAKYAPDQFQKFKSDYDIKGWFIEDDVKPIVSALRDVNWSEIEFRYFAFFCKIDYGLIFLKQYFLKLILSENENKTPKKKSQHDLRLDLAMSTIELIDVFVRTYGNLTQGKIRLGLGLERLNEIIEKEKEVFNTDNGKKRKDLEQKLIARLKGDEGHFKKAESYEKIKTGVNIWPYLP
jgi:hypothetical protein